MAALMFSNRNHQSDDAMTPLLWSTTVFFDRYLLLGADGTIDDFGPREPIQLRSIENVAK
jgi:hypothetical protein